MNIEQANAIPMPEIMQKIGCVPTKEQGADIWYLSPLRDEKTASFHINASKNVWYDFGIDKGGDVISFARAYLESQGEDCTPADALRWINNMMLSPVSILYVPREKAQEIKATLTVSKVMDIEHPLLVTYLESRGISVILAKKYLHEVVVCNANSGKKFHALGLTTVSEGFELRNKIFKGCIGTKSIALIRGTQVPAQEVHVFEGIMDFLSAVGEQKGQQFVGDAIILNSVSCLPQAFPYIKNYHYRSLYTWLDNDTAGMLATNALKELADKEGILTFQAMNKSYAPHKDVNSWHMQKPKM